MTISEEAALMGWSAIAEPSDVAAGALVAALGAAGALDWVGDGANDLSAAVAKLHGRCSRDVAEAAVRGHERWERRLLSANDPHARRAASVGARVITRGSPGWPSALAALGMAEPFALYVRGEADLDAAWESGVAVVGARSATAYGAHMSGELAEGVAAAGRAVLSGGAYGIDAAAHRATLSVDGVTVAVMAGGVDRLYPAGNDELLRAVIGRGAVVSEVPPGFAPHRSRFLTRNRLIAASAATVVVEAALRSGALNTARHASELLRPVGAVPGSATSPSSAGCHALIRDGAAILVAGADHVLELVDSASQWGERQSACLDGKAEAVDALFSVAPFDRSGQAESSRDPGRVAPRPEFEFASDRAVYDVTSRRGIAIEDIARRAGLAWNDAAAATGRLEMRGLIERSGREWKRVSAGPKSPKMV